jgi:Ca2+-dependent lipid-binding protein
MSKSIEVTLIGCAGLMGKQDSGFSDPVVHLSCNGSVQVSTVKQGTNSPVWNETFQWTVPAASRGVPLTLHVWNSPKFALGPDTKGAFLGTVSLDDVFQVRGKINTMILQKRSSRSNVSGSISIRVDDDESKASAQTNKATAGQPTATTSAASDSGASAPPSSAHARSTGNLSADDAKLLADFVSRAGNEQCADCDSKQVMPPPRRHCGSLQQHLVHRVLCRV